MECAHIWDNASLVFENDNEGFESPICLGVKGQGQIYSKALHYIWCDFIFGSIVVYDVLMTTKTGLLIRYDISCRFRKLLFTKLTLAGEKFITSSVSVILLLTADNKHSSANAAIDKINNMCINVYCQ